MKPSAEEGAPPPPVVAGVGQDGPSGDSAASRTLRPTRPQSGREPRAVCLADEADVVGFRAAARGLLAEGVEPDRVTWQIASAATADLFSASVDHGREVAPAVPRAEAEIRVPPFFVPLCETAALHADPGRFGLLYRLLWRLVHAPDLRHDALDADRLDAEKMARMVRRDMHKMTAFVRFRPIGEDAASAVAEAGRQVDVDVDVDSAVDLDDYSDSHSDGDDRPPLDLAPPHPQVDARRPEGPWHVAWFEPEHHIVRATAPFFARRFAQMRWAILTPECSVRWDGSTLAFGPGADRREAPPADAGEQLWLTYYAHIFNPARLKLKMMQKEMPRKYWHNLPEAVLIQPLTALAAQRSGQMVELGGSQPVHRRPAASLALRVDARPTGSASPHSLADLRDATDRCRDCPIGALATQAVPGEGAPGAPLMLVGEQPGDQEDLLGRPFVGPAGRLLDRALAQLGWSRRSLYMTNAVKHFKYELRGKRRIHKTAAQREAAACLHWLESEIDLVAPKAIVALGATAARALLGRAVAVTSERGRWLARSDGLPVLIALHPSALLRMDDAERDTAYRAWLANLGHASSYVSDEI